MVVPQNDPHTSQQIASKISYIKHFQNPFQETDSS
jgi:hypothetical protein